MEREYPNFLAAQEHQSEPQHTPPPKKPRGVFFLIGFLLCLFLGAFITRAIVSYTQPQDPNAYDLATLEPKKPKGLLGKIKEFMFHGDTELVGVQEDRINFLILGQGGPGHDGPYLTDTIILASIKPSTNQVAMMSIPRDLEVNIPGYGLRKINNANAFAEAKNPGSGSVVAKEVIEQTFSQSIHYYVRIDFQAFEKLIDKVGGVTINVDQSFVDAEYPIPGREDAMPISSRYKILKFTSGVQHMDGKTALEYARSRHGNNGEGSDYARSRRQQKVLLALKEKLLSFETLANPSKIYEILQTLSDHIDTNIQFSDMIALAKLARSLQTDKIMNLTLDDSPQGYLRSGYDSIGAFVLTPKTGSFDGINADLENIFSGATALGNTTSKVVENNTPEQSPTSLKTSIIEVHNGTWRSGLAAEMKTRLTTKKFVVGEVGNSIKRPQNFSAIYVLNSDVNTETLEQLKNELKFPIEKTVPEGEFYSKNSDILVILGEDFKP